MDSKTTAYALSNGWTDERRRMGLMSECLDGTSRRRLGATGVGPGWCCLEVGAGNGSVATWLAERVGPSGHVVATDVDTRFLEAAGGDVEVWCHDVVRDPMPENAFDLVHVRSLLMHLPDRMMVLARLVSALRPGGRLVVEESDVYPVLATATGPYREAWAEIAELLGRAGMAAGWARELPSVLAGMGLAGITAESEVQLFRGGSAWAELNQLTFLHAGSALTGAAARRLHEAIAALDDRDTWFPTPAVTAAHGIRGGNNS